MSYLTASTVIAAAEAVATAAFNARPAPVPDPETTRQNAIILREARKIRAAARARGSVDDMVRAENLYLWACSLNCPPSEEARR